MLPGIAAAAEEVRAQAEEAQQPEREPEPEGGQPPAQPETSAATEAVTQLQGALQAIAGRVDGLTQLVGQLVRGAATAPAQPGPEPNFDEMSTKDLVQHVINQVQAQVGSLRQEVAQELNKVVLGLQIERLATTPGNEDFFDYSDEVVKIMREGRARTVADAYALAKHENPGKARTPARPPQSPTGRAPVGGGGVTSSKPAPPVKNTQDAAQRAFRAVFGRNPRG